MVFDAVEAIELSSHAAIEFTTTVSGLSYELVRVVQILCTSQPILKRLLRLRLQFEKCWLIEASCEVEDAMYIDKASHAYHSQTEKIAPYILQGLGGLVKSLLWG